jgi:hypothetical protein
LESAAPLIQKILADQGAGKTTSIETEHWEACEEGAEFRSEQGARGNRAEIQLRLDESDHPMSDHQFNENYASFDLACLTS